MPESSKKSFVLYFDAYPNIRHMSLEQKGVLLDLLFQYAAQAAEGRAREPGEVLADHPEAQAETRMAFHFMGESIRRDTEKWAQKHQRYHEAAARRRFPGGRGEDNWLVQD